MEELRELKERMKTQRPADWDSLPDLSLYMDQVIGYMPRQLIQYGEAERLTSAMVNNYIKDGLLPRADGKRYNRTHLGYLTAICALKQVLPVKDAGLLVNLHAGQEEQARYAHFCAELDRALTDSAGRLDVDRGPEELPQLALTLALRSYADGLACRRVMELIRQAEGGETSKKSKKERKEEKRHE